MQIDEAIERLRHEAQRDREVSAKRGDWPDCRGLISRADAIDLLLAQLAEARANAVPWRDGPAVEGGSMPPRDIEVVAVCLIYGSHAAIFAQRRLANPWVENREMSVPGHMIVRWCYVADLLPAATAKGAP